MKLTILCTVPPARKLPSSRDVPLPFSQPLPLLSQSHSSPPNSHLLILSLVFVTNASASSIPFLELYFVVGLITRGASTLPSRL
jgi:hypothetical protein